MRELSAVSRGATVLAADSTLYYLVVVSRNNNANSLQYVVTKDFSGMFFRFSPDFTISKIAVFARNPFGRPEGCVSISNNSGWLP